MTDPARTQNTIPHHSYCDWCGVSFTPRVALGPKRGRFCQRAHKDRWWNRRRKENPPLLQQPAGDARKKKQRPNPTTIKPESKLRLIMLKRRGERLAFTHDEIATARRRAQELERAACKLLDTPGGFLTPDETRRVFGFRSREAVRLLVLRGSLPAPVVLCVAPRRVGFRSVDVERLLRERAQRFAA